MAKSVMHWFPNGVAEKAHKHSNGGGWVSDAAKVPETVYVSSDSTVQGKPKIDGDVRIENKSSIKKSPQISGTIKIRDSIISGTTQVQGLDIWIESSRIDGSAKVLDGAEVRKSSVSGDAVIKDFAEINGTSIYGRAMVTGSARIFATEPCTVTLRGDAWLRGDTVIDVHRRMLLEGKATCTITPLIIRGGFLEYPIVITDNVVLIGCQSHTPKEWRKRLLSAHTFPSITKHAAPVIYSQKEMWFELARKHQLDARRVAKRLYGSSTK